MKSTWDGVVEDSFSKRCMLQLKSEDEIDAAIEKVADDIRSIGFNTSKLVLNVNFHVESSIVYIYPCTKSDLIREIKVRYIIQLCFLSDAFECMEKKYYKDADFYEIEHKKLVNQYLNYIYPKFNNNINSAEIDIVYTEQRWTDESGLEYVEIDTFE